ncbi:hypothetical protein [Ponticoccus sp. (in: a-proteobacteria)]|uniref:hypothetical protein n=1 Tax=Ponticoccus sp. (in: a-proteobacteria) TaxID=1925025 RepID=UPI003AB301B8
MLSLLMLVDTEPARLLAQVVPAGSVPASGGAVPGTLLGALFYARSDPDMIRLLIGVISVGFVASEVADPRLPGQGGAAVRGGRGLGVGRFWASPASSVRRRTAAAIFLLGRGLDKTRYRRRRCWCSGR